MRRHNNIINSSIERRDLDCSWLGWTPFVAWVFFFGKSYIPQTTAFHDCIFCLPAVHVAALIELWSHRADDEAHLAAHRYAFACNLLFAR